MIKKNIPNFFTSLNFLCGCLASYFAFKSLFEAAFLLVLIGVFFDLFDGFFARLLKVESNFGLQFDSMADLITSGFVPGIVMYKLLLQVGLKEMDFSLNIINVDDYDITMSDLYAYCRLDTLAMVKILEHLTSINIENYEL